MTAGIAPQVSGAHEEVHVTIRRILATLVDFLIFAFAGMSPPTDADTLTRFVSTTSKGSLRDL